VRQGVNTLYDYLLYFETPQIGTVLYGMFVLSTLSLPGTDYCNEGCTTSGWGLSAVAIDWHYNTKQTLVYKHL
jgi:hypothetical protein